MLALPAGSHERTTRLNFLRGGHNWYRASQEALIKLPSGGVGFCWYCAAKCRLPISEPAKSRPVLACRADMPVIMPTELPNVTKLGYRRILRAKTRPAHRPDRPPRNVA